MNCKIINHYLYLSKILINGPIKVNFKNYFSDYCNIKGKKFIIIKNDLVKIFIEALIYDFYNN